MASPLDDLEFSIHAHVRDAMDDIKALSAQLDNVLKHVGQIDASFRSLGQAMNHPAAQVDLLSLRLQPMVHTLARAEKQAGALEESFTRKLMLQALENQYRKVIQLADGTQRARYEMLSLGDASTQLRIPTQAPRTGGSDRGGGRFSLARVTAAAAQLAVLTRVSSTMRTVGQSVQQVGRTSQITATHMDRFRMGLAAPQVNPEMNVIKNGIEKVGDAAAKTLNKVREAADAVASDLPGTVGAAVNALGKINQELDKASLSASKHVSRMQSSSKGLTLLGRVFPFLKSKINDVQAPFDMLRSKAEAGTNKLDQTNAKVAAHANQLRNARFVMDGTFQSLGGSADLFARAAFHANLPVRLLKREWEGATRVVRAGQHVWNFVTKPIHAAAVAIGHSRDQFRAFRHQLPPLTGGLQLGTRLFRGFAHATYLTGPVATVATKATSGIARGLAGLLSPAKLATQALAKLTGVQNTFIGRAVGMKPAAKDAADAVTKIGSSSAVAARGMSGLNSKAGMAKTAMAAGLAGMVALGTNTAIATEKNQAIFGAMLHDMGQGAAAVKSIQGTKAARFFDNQQLLDSGRLLNKAGVAASGLAAKTDQFAKIAVGASVDISMLADRYMQGFQQTHFGLGQINDMAREGVAIYTGLEAATGKSGSALRQMIEGGKIGMAEMDAALAHLTEGHGIYAGSLDAMANTTAGKMATIKNNVSQALGQVMGVALQVLAPFGTAVVKLSEGLSGAFQSLREPIMYGATAMAWFFGNFVDIGKFAFATFALLSVSTFNDFIYFFSTKIPAYLTWFSQNWRQVFTDAGTLIVTVFTNIGRNIGSAMKAIWAYIKSGGTAELQFAFVPLLDGFRKTVSELPNIPERAMTDLEKQLTRQTEQLGGNLADSFDEMLANASQQLNDQLPALSDQASAAVAHGEDGPAAAEKAARNAVENKAVGVRTAEGQSLAAQIQRGMLSQEDKILKEQQTTNTKLEDIFREIKNGKPVGGKPFRGGR